MPGGGQASAEDVTGVFALNLTKQIVATSLSETGTDAFDPALTDLAVGETVTYRLTATLSEGTQTLVITDTLPAGLGLVSAAVNAGAPGALSAATAAMRPAVRRANAASPAGCTRPSCCSACIRARLTARQPEPARRGVNRTV